MKVAILGAGAYGGALSKILRANGNATKFFDPWKFPERSLEEVLAWAEAALLVTPAEAVKRLLGQFPAEAQQKPLIVATKGVMDLSLYANFEHVELISGPGFASEILQNKKIKLTVATWTGRAGWECWGEEAKLTNEGEKNKNGESGKTNESLAERLFEGEQVKFDKTEDAKGVAMLSGLKNIYAIEAGRRGLKYGTGEFKGYIHAALKEAEKFLLYNGGFLETVRLSAGVGDFVLTCGSRESRNYRFGERLGGEVSYKLGGAREKKRKIKEFLRDNTVEGVHAAKEIARLGLFVPRELEILPDILRRICAA